MVSKNATQFGLTAARANKCIILSILLPDLTLVLLFLVFKPLCVKLSLQPAVV